VGENITRKRKSDVTSQTEIKAYVRKKERLRGTTGKKKTVSFTAGGAKGRRSGFRRKKCAGPLGGRN